MRALFNQFRVFDHEDDVRTANRAEIMGDGDGRSSLHQRPQRSDDGFLGGGVQAGGRLVENQDRRIANDRPGNGDALALTAREGGAALADHGVVAVGHLFDEFMRDHGARLILKASR